MSSLVDPLVEYYGSYADYVIVGASVDRLDILSFEVHVPRADPIEWTKFNRVSAPTNIVPIPCVGVRLNKGKGDHAIIYSYDGKLEVPEYQFPGVDPAVYELEGTDSSEPIETHDQFLALVKKYGGTYNADGSFSGFPKLMPGKQVKNPLYGQTDYTNIGWVWTKSYTAAAIPQKAYRNAGCVDKPDWGQQQPIELPGVQDYLRLAPRCDWRGNVWRITERWRASGRAGINKDVYRQVT